MFRINLLCKAAVSGTFYVGSRSSVQSITASNVYKSLLQACDALL
jgi:hypothetical protein